MSTILRLACLATLVCLPGCAATVRTAEGAALRIDSAEFRQYAERVFREQNRVATELAYVLEDLGANEAERERRLLALEEALLAECARLNELAAAERDGRKLGWLRAVRAARRLPACEAATLDVRAALPL